MTVRDHMIRFLREELIGPKPGLPFVQLNGEEVLTPEDSPRIRYGAGILFPTKLLLDQQEDNEVDADQSDVDGTADDSGKVIESKTGNISGEQHELADERGDGQPETELEVNRANEFLPSALGITALMKVPETLSIYINAAQYHKETVSGESYIDKEGQIVPLKYWFRTPLGEKDEKTGTTKIRIDIDGAEILAKERDVIEKELVTVNDGTRLCLHIFQRSHSIEGGSADARYITFTLINRTEGKERPDDEECFFQCGLSVRSADDSGFILEYPDKILDLEGSSEELELDLLFRSKRIYAVGHGCAPEWEEGDRGCSCIYTSSLPDYEIKPIRPSEMDGINLNMLTLSKLENDDPLDICSSLADGYESWIRDIEIEANDPNEVPNYLKAAASRNIVACRSCLSRIRGGIELLKNNSTARQAFSFMNRVMLMQHLHYSISTENEREWVVLGGRPTLSETYSPPDYDSEERMWRPFQLAFVLMTIRSIVLETDDDLDERDLVDLIWFPTGGGKTEAYLGLAAFTILYRRLVNPENAGTTAIMRYTLRLLTTQQFQRAASLICACEVIRRKTPEIFGEEAITIGLWVGGGVTPNKEKAAVYALNKLHRGDKENPFIILSCPWCGAQMGPVKSGTRTRTQGYRKLTNPNRVRLICDDPDCEFHVGDGLPIRIIDEHIYSSPPTLLIGTVDKFALLPWYPEARVLFGIGIEDYDPPDLIIQDELHLISGPLGSMVGHYETVVDALTGREHIGKPTRAKIVASTATISRAPEQIEAIYGGRESCLFPPQGLMAGESYFATERIDQVGRTYLGVFASGLPSLTTTEVRVLSSLLQAPAILENAEDFERDPYWTLMVYFNSIRELGHAATLLKADIPEYMNVNARRHGLQKFWGDERAALRRFINHDMELTGRIQNSEITEYMKRLFKTYSSTERTDPVDVCLATNMIQVGLDVQRLSLMAIIGQPKTTSEYIQASSRVGRSGEGPGLVAAVLSPSKPRDKSHFEHFRAFHQSIYKYVEPTSVTPFALPVSERALHALVITLARFWGDDAIRDNPLVPPSDELEKRIRDDILKRVSDVESAELGRVESRLDMIFRNWNKLPPDVYGGFSPPDDVVPFMHPSGTHPKDSWDSRSISTLSSMRNVDAQCNARVLSGYGDQTLEELGDADG